MLPNDRISPIFQATAQATEAAITNALLAAETMTGAEQRAGVCDAAGPHAGGDAEVRPAAVIVTVAGASRSPWSATIPRNMKSSSGARSWVGPATVSKGSGDARTHPQLPDGEHLRAQRVWAEGRKHAHERPGPD